jgi:hypothetical protein
MATTTMIQTQRYAPYQEQRMQELYNTLFGIGKPGDTNYLQGLLDKARPVPAQQLAKQTQDQIDAMAMQRADIAAGLPQAQLAAAQQTAGAGLTAAAAGQAALAQGLGQFAPTAAAIKQFEDPYSQLVTQEALKEIDRQGALSTQALAAQAQQAGAFGGSRFGLQGAELARNIQDIKSRRIYEDQSRNYQQALGAAMASQEAAAKRAIGVGQQYGAQVSGLGSLANIQGSLAQARQGMDQGDVRALLGIGKQNQAFAQTGLDLARANVLAQQAEPYGRLEFGSNILQGMPAGTIQQPVAAGPLYMQSPFAAAIGGGLLGLRGYEGLTQGIPGGIGNLGLV